MRKVILRVQTDSIEEFEEIVKYAAESGITHVIVTEIEKSIWQWNRDRFDPYPSWQLYQPTIFKLVVPEKLKKYLPVEYAEKNLEMVRRRTEILKKYGLKAAFWGSEPSYLPEEVYQDHPDWRGGRCDQTRRSRKAYYSPCVNNPEVREMYEEAITKLCSIAPIEYFRFHTNDCGSGFCWSSHLYPGPNGPLQCKETGAVNHAIGFLDLVQKAAAKAGLKAEAGYQAIFVDGEEIALTSLLKEGMFYADRTGGKDGKLMKSFGMGNWLEGCPAYPVKDISELMQYGYSFIDTSTDKDANLFIYLFSTENKALLSLIKKEIAQPDSNAVELFRTLKEIADDFIGNDYAGKLVDVWNYIHRAVNQMNYLEHGGLITFLGPVHQRWLVRPLVPFPEELKPEEKAYYRDFQFQARSEEEANDLINLQATRWLDGNGGHFLINKAVRRTNNLLTEAIRRIGEILETYKGPQESYLLTLKTRLEMFRCMMTTIDHVVHYQRILDGTDKSTPPTDFSTIHTDQGDIRIHTMMELTRAEIDNTYAMIHLLEKDLNNVLYLEQKVEDENVFYYSTNIIENMKKKIKLMQTKMPDLERLYATYNI